MPVLIAFAIENEGSDTFVTMSSGPLLHMQTPLKDQILHNHNTTISNIDSLSIEEKSGVNEIFVTTHTCFPKVKRSKNLINNNYETEIPTNNLSVLSFQSKRGGNNKILDPDIQTFGNFLSNKSRQNISSVASDFGIVFDKRKTVNELKKEILKKLLNGEENADAKSIKILGYLRAKDPQKLSLLSD